MRIAFMVQGMESGGTEKVVSVLADLFVKKGHSVVIFQLDETSSFYTLNNKIIFDSLHYKKNGFFGTARSFNREIADRSIDIVIAMASKPIILAAYASLSNKKPLITSERTDPNRYRKVIKLALKWAYGRSDLLVCPGKYVSDYYKKTCSTRTVIPNPIRVFSDPVDISRRKNIIVSAGRLIEAKNFGLLIESFKIFDSSNSGYELRIYGDGPLRPYLQEKIVSLGLQNKVFLMGNVEDLHNELRFAKLYICSSDIEGFPNALFEAMKLGLPLVSTRFPTRISEEYIKDGVNGYTVVCNDKVQLAEKMSDILSDTDTIKKMISNNLETGRLFEPESVAELWIESIEKLKD